MLVMITGGARSGKSRFAEQYAACLGSRGYYIATSRIWDDEMRDRVALHQSGRAASDFPWETVEEPLLLAEAVERLGCLDSTGEERGRREVGAHREAGGQGENGGFGEHGGPVETNAGRPVILVDCLTLWLTSVLFSGNAGGDEIDWDSAAMDRAAKLADREVARLIGVLRQSAAPVLLVTNEVGDGIVPEYPLGRLFRDLAGRMNQQVAAVCDEVFLVTAGIPVELKRLAFRLPPQAPPGTNGKGEGL